MMKTFYLDLLASAFDLSGRRVGDASECHEFGDGAAFFHNFNDELGVRADVGQNLGEALGRALEVQAALVFVRKVNFGFSKKLFGDRVQLVVAQLCVFFDNGQHVEDEAVHVPEFVRVVLSCGARVVHFFFH